MRLKLIAVHLWEQLSACRGESDTPEVTATTKAGVYSMFSMILKMKILKMVTQLPLLTIKFP